MENGDLFADIAFVDIVPLIAMAAVEGAPGAEGKETQHLYVVSSTNLLLLSGV
jgi:hypothetical protein